MRITRRPKLWWFNIGLDIGLVKLVEKMCKYEMDAAIALWKIQRAQFCPEMNRQTDRQSETVYHHPHSMKQGNNGLITWVYN